MALTFGKSTYGDLYDAITFEIADPRTDKIPRDAFQGWIIDAQRKVCELVNVGDYYRLFTKIGVADYPFQDRPPITNATNTTPIVITAVGHGLTTGDRIFIRDVRGNTAANGYFQVTVLTSDTFSLFGWVDINSTTGQTISTSTDIGIRSGVQAVTAGAVTVKYSSPLSSDTYALDARFYDSNGAWVMSVLYSAKDANGFTITIPDAGTLTYVAVESVEVTISGTTTTVLTSTVGNGTYTGGGRFWRSDEIPTMFKDFEPLERIYGDYRPRVEMREFDYIQRERKYDLDTLRTYSEYDAPACASIHDSGGGKVLTFYPDPVLAEQVNMNGYIQVHSKDYYSDSETTPIILPQDYDELIVFWVKMKAYERMREVQSKIEMLAMFDDAIKTMRRRRPRHIVMDVNSD
jgi:hypothetical protein